MGRESNRRMRFVALAVAVTFAGCELLSKDAGDDGGGRDASRARDAGMDAVATLDGAPPTDARPGRDPETDFGVPEQGSEEVAAGEMVTVGPVTVIADPDALSGPITIEARVTELPAALPEGVFLAGQSVDITVSDQDAILAPLQIQLHFDPGSIGGDEQLAVMHYDEALGYEPLNIISVDEAAGIVTCESRSFSSFAVARMWLPPTAHNTGFDPARHAWPIPNVYGGPVSGTCLGMSAFAAWSFITGQTPTLHDRFTSSIAGLLAIRAQMMTNAVYLSFFYGTRLESPTSSHGFIARLKTSVFTSPTVLGMKGTAGYDARRTGVWDHAVLLVGYDEYDFFVWDPEMPDDLLRLPHDDERGQLGPDILDASGQVMFRIGTSTRGVLQANIIPLASAGAGDDFAAMLSAASAGFPTDPDLVVEAPDPFLELNDRVLEIRGSFSGTLNPGSAAYALSQGYIFPLATESGRFSGVIPAFAGDLGLYVLVAPRTSGASLAYRNAAVRGFSLVNAAPQAEIVASVSWAAPADVDLYLIAPDGTPIYLLNQSDAVVGEMGLSSSDGSLPEYIYVSEARGHTVMPGPYTIRAHLYEDSRGAGAPAFPAVAHIHINEGAANRRYWRCDIALSSANSGNANPDDVGPDWVDIGTLDMDRDEIMSDLCR